MKILVPSVKHSGATILVNQMMDSYEQLTLRNPGEGIVSDHVIYTKVDESKLDEKYFSVIPESRKLDKKALLKDAKVSSINGVKLTESKRSLTIK